MSVSLNTPVLAHNSPGPVAAVSPRSNRYDVEGVTKSLQEYAAKGAWRKVYKVTDSIKYTEKEPRDAFFFQVRYYRVLALVKLRMFKNANEEVAGLRLDHAECPFRLKLLHATVPSCVGNHQLALDLLYVLLQALTDANERRHTQLAIVSVLTRQKDLVAAIELVESMEADGALLSLLMELYLELGDVQAAREVCEEAEKLLEGREGRQAMNRGLVLFGEGRYEEAQKCFEAAEEKEEELRGAAVNNKAVCMLFDRRLEAAVELLEDSLAADPEHLMRETLVGNVFILLDLSSDKPQDRKAAVGKLVAAHGGDGFDSSAVDGSS